MKFKSFATRLCIITFLLAIVIIGIATVPGFSHTLGISVFSLVFFVLLNLAIYFAGIKSALSADPNSLTRLIMFLVFFKMFTCLLIVIVYDQYWNPASNHYILPFLIIYVTYTVFEVLFLSKISKLKV
jgi:hypothetical protein